MGKRKKKQAARRRGISADQRQRQRQRARADLLYDPGTGPDVAAEILRESFGDGPVDPVVASTIRVRSSMDRLRAVSEAVLAHGRDATSLSLAADVALMDGRVDDAERYAAQAVELADHPDLHLRRALALGGQGRVAEAIDVLDAQLRANPGLDAAQFARRDLLARAEPGVVERFLDRTAMVELLGAIGRRYTGSEGLEDWIEAGALTEDEAAELAALAAADLGSPEARRLRLIGEWAWLMPVLDDDRSPLEAIFDDEDAPEGLRRHVEDWLTWAQWGLWEVQEPRGGPGAVLVELVTGVMVHAAVPADLLEGLPRWSVLLGYLVPVDGVWRSGSDFEVLTPLEARLLVHELLDELMANADEVGKEGRAMVAWARSVHEELGPLWLPGASEQPAPEATVSLQLALRAFPPHLLAGVRAMRGTAPPEVEDEEAGGVFALTLDDPDAAWEALAAHDDFEPAEGGGLVWLDEEDEDEARAYLDREEGATIVEADRDQLAALLEELRGLGHPATAEELPDDDEPPKPPVALPDLPDDDLPAWLRAWPDAPLDLFDGTTPREAAEDDDVPDVEMLVRYLEHDADRRGLRDLDMAALREQLGLEKQ